MTVIVNAQSISIYFASDDDTVTHKFTPEKRVEGKKPKLIYYGYLNSLDTVLKSDVRHTIRFTVENCFVDKTNYYVHLENYIFGSVTFYLPNFEHFNSIVRIITACDTKGLFTNKRSKFSEQADFERPCKLANRPPTFDIHKNNYGVILQPVGEENVTYSVIPKLHELLGDFTIVQFSYVDKIKGDKLKQSLQLYDEKESSDPKVEICYYTSSISDINLFLGEISKWLTTISIETRIPDLSHSGQVAQPPDTAQGGSGDGFYLRLRFADASCLG